MFVGVQAPTEMTHIRLLEAESIQLLREVAAEFARPALLYSIGKDSSVLLRLIVHQNVEAVREAANPFRLGSARCCAQLKTKALLDAIAENRIDAAIGG